MRLVFLTVAQSLRGWAMLFEMLAEWSSCEGGYRDGE